MDFCCFLISCQISPSLSPVSSLSESSNPAPTFLRQSQPTTLELESFNCRHVTAHPPRHLSTPSLLPPFLHSTLPSPPQTSQTCIFRTDFSWDMHSVCVVARLRDSSYVWDMKVVSSSYGDATHPCRDCRVAKPFSADALRRKGERRRVEGGSKRSGRGDLWFQNT